MAACDFCDSRAELVNRAINLEAENRHLRRALAEQQRLMGEDPNASLVVTLYAVIAGLEANVDRLSKRGKKAA